MSHYLTLRGHQYWPKISECWEVLKKTFLRYISNGSETPYVCYFIIFKDCSSLSQRCKICHIYILICYNSVVLPVLLDPIQTFPNSVVSETHIQGHHINTNMKVKIKSKKFQTFNFNIFWSWKTSFFQTNNLNITKVVRGCLVGLGWGMCGV